MGHRRRSLDDLAEDRDRFRIIMRELGIPQPASGMASSLDEARQIAAEIGYPLMVRPSYVLGGRGMEIIRDEKMLARYVQAAVALSPERPILIDKFLDNAVEAEADAIADGTDAFVPAVMEHIELAGVHSGDSACVIPPISIAPKHIDTIYQYNPGYNRWSTDPAGPHKLVMPIDVADQFVTALAQVPVADRVRWKRHKVKNGEAISQIAEKYNTTVSTIRAANNLRGNTIRAGHHLMIPVATKPLSAYSQSADARLAKTQNRTRAGSKVEHVVRKGESFWTISRHYKVTHRQLAAWNGMALRAFAEAGATTLKLCSIVSA